VLIQAEQRRVGRERQEMLARVVGQLALAQVEQPARGRQRRGRPPVRRRCPRI
jgi:hypothetical protein